MDLSSDEQRKQERHREVLKAVGSCVDDNSEFATLLQRPVAGTVFLGYAVTRSEACAYK